VIGRFAAFVLRRLIAAVVLIATVSSGAFVLGHFVPGDATTELVLSRAGADAIAHQRARLGLDRPLSQQFAAWVAGLVRLDLGTSATYGRPVSQLVAERALNSARLGAAALGIALVLGLPLGLLSGASPRSLVALAVTPISIALVSCPPLVGALALLLLAVHTRWLPVAPGTLAVPALALGLPFAAMLERLQSRSTSDTLSAPSLVAAAARGVPPRRLLWVHAARQSLRPVLGVFGIVIGALFSGSLAVEYVTAWPGLGRLMYDALTSRDLFLVAGCALAGALFLAAGNLVADVIRAALDPRVRDVR
jgi:ABC-type dipeptide/oligopeptide/nickel transport system permease component